MTVSVEELQVAELNAVHRVATVQAQILGLNEPTLEQVENAERDASGSIDYGLKWALGVVSAMKELRGTECIFERFNEKVTR